MIIKIVIYHQFAERYYDYLLGLPLSSYCEVWNIGESTLILLQYND